jgi:F-type H+-transporting ATPase subunit delta
MINKKVARRYTLALYETAVQMKLKEKVRKDLVLIRNAIDGSRELKLFLHSPIISSEKKINILTLLFSKKVTPLTMKFIRMLAEKSREGFLYDICQDYCNLQNEKSGIAEAIIKTSIKLTDKEKKHLIDKLKSYTGKNIEAKYIVDPSLKGGFVAHIDDTIFDASIVRQLEILYLQLKEGRFNGA